MLTAEERILDAGYEDVIIFGSGNGSGDSYDDALIGVSSSGCAVYDFEKMVDWLMEKDGMTSEEAIEWIEYNSIRSLPYVGEGAPIIVYPV